MWGLDGQAAGYFCDGIVNLQVRHVVARGYGLQVVARFSAQHS